jgi:hypothetical protein
MRASALENDFFVLRIDFGFCAASTIPQHPRQLLYLIGSITSLSLPIFRAAQHNVIINECVK